MSPLPSAVSATRAAAARTAARLSSGARALAPQLARQLTATGAIWGFRAGWGIVRALPETAAYSLFDTAADLTVRRGGSGVRRLRSNYAKVRPELDDACLDALVREGMRSYMRYYCDAFRLPTWTRAELERTVVVRNGDSIRAHLEQGTSCVVFVAHMGNWDTAGAWSTTFLAPVTTIAERLEPEEVFEDFLGFREDLGMTILPLTGGPDPFAGLLRAADDGQFIALVADRDLTHNGVEVDLCGHRARVAKGPAVLALMKRIPLYAAAITYEPTDEPGVPGGRHVVVEFSEPVVVPEHGSTRDKVPVMVQACMDFLGERIRAHTQDWHMLQRVFVDDLDPERTPSVPVART